MASSVEDSLSILALLALIICRWRRRGRKRRGGEGRGGGREGGRGREGEGEGSEEKRKKGEGWGEKGKEEGEGIKDTSNKFSSSYTAMGVA